MHYGALETIKLAKADGNKSNFKKPDGSREQERKSLVSYRKIFIP